MWLLNVRDIYELDQDGTRSIVVKHFPPNVNVERLQSYLEFICGIEKLKLILPQHGCDIAVGILDTDIPVADAVIMFQENIFSSPINGHYPELTPLGSPTGVFIENAQADSVDPDDIMTHMKSFASVGNSKRTNIASQQYLGINIPVLSDAHTLLKKERLTVCDQVVTLQPYYPVICDYIVEKLVGNENNAYTERESSESQSLKNISTNSQPEEVSEAVSLSGETFKSKITMGKGNLFIIFDSPSCQSENSEGLDNIEDESFLTSTWCPVQNNDSDVEVKPDESDEYSTGVVSNDRSDEETEIFTLPNSNTTKIATVKPFCVDRHSPVPNLETNPTYDRKAKESTMSQVKKDHTKKAEVTLELSMARCFQSCFENKLQKEVIASGGTLNVEKLVKDPVKIKLVVEGNDHVVDILKRTNNSIWHESLDFGKIASDRDEIWLLMKNLNGDIGENFMYTFEKDNNCFIDMVEEGKFELKRPSVQVDSVDESSSETDTDDELNGFGAVGGIDYDDQDKDTYEGHCPTFDERPMDESRHNHKHIQYKRRGRMSSESLLKKVTKQSLLDEHSHVSHKRHSGYSQKQQDKLIGNRNSHPTRKSRREKVNGVSVQILKDKIVEQKADVLVNIVNGSSPNPFNTAVATSFLEVGGEELLQEYQANQGRQHGSMLVTTRSTGNIRCNTVFHVTIRKGSDCEQVVDKAMKKILYECERSRFGTVAIPPIGAGRMFRFQPHVVAERMFSNICNYFKDSRMNQLQYITIVIYDDRSYDEFDAAFTRAIRSNARFDNQIQLSQHKSFDVQESRKIPYSRALNQNTRIPHSKHHTSRSSNKISITKLKITVFAENKSECVKARDKLSMAIKKTFLHEEHIRSQNLSRDAKARIARILNKCDVMSSKDSKSGNYVLKGHSEKVTKTRAAIYEEILKDNSTKKPKRNCARHTPEYVHMMVKVEPEAPKYWNHYKEDMPVKDLIITTFKSFMGSKHKKVELETTTPEYREILKMMNETFYPDKVGLGSDAAGIPKGSYRRLHVLKIERVENLELYEKFAIKRQSLFRYLWKNKSKSYPLVEDLPNCEGQPLTSKYRQGVLGRDMHPEINEHLLFHGTKCDVIDVVCNNGFDQKVGTRSAMLGQGVYGAESSTKADQYADSQTNRSFGAGNKKKMFLIRMLLGNPYVSSDSNPHKFVRPPCTKCRKDNCNDARHGKGIFGHFFDSVIGENGKLFREFVVYDGELCYPEYLITYERL